MNRHLIARCGRCRAVWAVDFEEYACTCPEFVPHVDDRCEQIAAPTIVQAVARFEEANR